MADDPINEGLERKLRQSISRFVSPSSESKQPLVAFFQSFRSYGWAAVVFGGVLRDLMTGYGASQIRDVDIVVLNASVDDLARACQAWFRRRTRFGGLHLHAGAWPIDIWNLEKTWAFHTDRFEPSFADLPKTTFLNAEAVAVSLFPDAGGGRSVYSHGFFECLRTRTLELNYSENPFPELSVVRSLFSALRLRYSLGPKLCAYISEIGKEVGVEQLEAIQRDHYGRVRCTGEYLRSWIERIREHQATMGSATFEPTSFSQFSLDDGNVCSFCAAYANRRKRFRARRRPFHSSQEVLPLFEK
jgi:hypothetical protein